MEKLEIMVRQPGETTYAKLLDDEALKCLFNPVNLELKKGAEWKALPAVGNDKPAGTDYIGGKPATMSLNLRMDSTHTGASVQDAAAKVRELVEVKLPAGSKTWRPPTIMIVWGQSQTIPYEFACTSYAAKFTLFAEDGTPLRAEVTLGLEEYVEEAEGPNPTSVTLLPQRLHRVQPGETLDRISVAHYGTPNLWRGIAAANVDVIGDPFDLRPGLLLAIPAKKELTRG